MTTEREMRYTGFESLQSKGEHKPSRLWRIKQDCESKAWDKKKNKQWVTTSLLWCILPQVQNSVLTSQLRMKPPPPQKKKKGSKVFNFDFLKLIMSIFSQPLLQQNWKSEETDFQEIPTINRRAYISCWY